MADDKQICDRILQLLQVCSIHGKRPGGFFPALNLNRNSIVLNDDVGRSIQKCWAVIERFPVGYIVG
jgi:hypothetical protein